MPLFRVDETTNVARRNTDLYTQEVDDQETETDSDNNNFITANSDIVKNNKNSFVNSDDDENGRHVPITGNSARGYLKTVQ